MFNINDYRVTDKNYTHQSLRGGKYNIPDDKEKEFLKYSVEHPELCLCEKLPETFPLYFDIDKMDEKFELDDILEKTADLLSTYYEKEDENNFEYYVLTNKSKPNNHHVYFPEIIVNKKIARSLCEKLNYDMNDIFHAEDDIEDNFYEIFDGNAYNSCFRMGYTGKYNHKDKMLDTESIYELNPNYNDELHDRSTLTKLRFFSIRKNMDDEITELGSDFNSELDTDKKKEECKESIEQLEKNIAKLEEMQKKLEFSEKMARMKFYRKALTRNNNKILWEILNCITQFRCDDFKEWMRIIYIFKNSGLPVDVLITWSQRSYKWNDKAYEIITNIMTSVENTDENQVSVKKLLFFAKEDNPEKFSEIIFPVSRYEYFDLYVDKTYIRDNIKYGERGLGHLASVILKNRLLLTMNKKQISCFSWNGDIWEIEKNDNSLSLIISDILLYLLNNLSMYNNQVKKKDDNGEGFLNDIEAKELYCCLKMVQKIEKINSIRKWIYAELDNRNNKQEMDSNRDILSVKNGVIDLKTGKLRPRQYDDYLTTYIDTNYDPNIDTSTVEEYFSNLMLDDMEKVRYMQTSLGYGITGHISEQKIFIWTGSGSNGKSLTTTLLSKLLEKHYFCSLSGNALSTNYKGGAATTEYNGLEHSRMAFLDESNKKQSLNEGVIKRFTGGTQIKIRKLYGEEEDLNLEATFFLATNYLPHITDDPALHRRIIVFPFNAKFLNEHTREKYDPKNPNHRKLISPEKLYKNVSKEKLLTWIVKGAVEWYANGFSSVPEEINAKTEDYLTEADKLKEYIKFCCEPTEREYATSLALFLENYKQFAQIEMTQKQLKDELERKGFSTFVKKGKRHISYQIVRDVNDEIDEC